MTRPIQWLRLQGFARGPLRRGSDWAEMALFFGMLIAACMVVPVGLKAAEIVVAEQTQAAAEQTVRGYQTVATLTEDVPVVIAFSELGPGPQPQTAATWRAPDGSLRTGAVDADPGGKAGQRIALWTDERGAPVPAPTPVSDVRTGGDLIAVAAGVMWLLGVVLARLVIGWALRRKRMESWAQEWERVERDWRRTS